MKQYFKAILITSLLLISSSISALNVVLRYDDPTLQPDSITYDMLNFLAERNIPITLAVIPCDKNEEYILPTDSAWLNLLKADNVEIALHGLTHQDLGKGEFGGLTFEESYRRLSKGKNFLEAQLRPITTFIPPFNAYNENTLNAMDSLGLTAISADLFISRATSNKNIQYYPETLGHSMKNGVFEAAKKALSTNLNRDALCVIMLHHYDINTPESFNKLKELVNYLLNNKDIKLLKFNELPSLNEFGSLERFNRNCNYNLLYKKLNLGGVLYKDSFLVTLKVLNTLIYIIIALLPLLLFKTTRKLKYILPFLIIVSLTIAYIPLTPLKLLFATTVIGVASSIIIFLYDR